MDLTIRQTLKAAKQRLNKNLMPKNILAFYKDSKQ
jgi:hypothetical protein